MSLHQNLTLFLFKVIILNLYINLNDNHVKHIIPHFSICRKTRWEKLIEIEPNPLDKRRCCDVESTSLTLIQRCNNVVCPVVAWCWPIVLDAGSTLDQRPLFCVCRPDLQGSECAAASLQHGGHSEIKSGCKMDGGYNTWGQRSHANRLRVNLTHTPCLSASVWFSTNR